MFFVKIEDLRRKKRKAKQSLYPLNLLQSLIALPPLTEEHQWREFPLEANSDVPETEISDVSVRPE